MAVIQSIRNRAGILVSVVIGMALVAFILGDFLTGSSNSSSRADTSIAKVNGKNLSYQEFQEEYSRIEEITKGQYGTSSLDAATADIVRDQTWNSLIDNMIMDREYKKIGLAISSAELSDLILGENLHPYIQNILNDPSNGINDRATLYQVVQQLNELGDNEITPDKLQFDYMQEMIVRDRLKTKYTYLINNGLYATKLETARNIENSSKNIDFSYVIMRYSEVPDSSIKVSDSEARDYYKEHLEEFKQTASRDIRYISWDVLPTQEDFNAAEKWINKEYEEFKAIPADETMNYIRTTSDISPDYAFHKQSDLTDTIKMFAFNAEPGDVYGPYFEDNYYKIAKLSEIKYLPDSVNASHILFEVNNSNYMQVMSLADSLKDLIKNGANINTLALEYSSDQSVSINNGDLGWFKPGEMVQPFSDSCFFGKVGDVVLAQTQYGLHIIKINKQSKSEKNVQIGILAHEVRPGEATDNNIYSLAAGFGAKNNSLAKFNEAIDADPTLQVRPVYGLLNTNKTVTGLEDSRDLVQWAFSEKEGSVSKKVFEYNDKYVIAILDKINEDGYTPYEDVKNIIASEVIRQKKAEKLISELKEASSSVSTINDVATKINKNIQTATNVNFNSFSIPGLGAEPKLLATADNLDKGALSGPIDGQNGVYVIQVDNITLTDNTNVPSIAKSTIERGYSTKVYSQLDEVLNKMAEVEDNRINFF